MASKFFERRDEEIKIFMRNLIDYVFFRAYTFYKKKDSTPVFMSCLVVSVVLFFNVLDILSILQLFLKFPAEVLNKQKPIIVIVLLLILWLVWRYFKSSGRLLELQERYNDENTILRRRNGVLIVLYIVISILIPISIGILRKNFDIDI